MRLLAAILLLTAVVAADAINAQQAPLDSSSSAEQNRSHEAVLYSNQSLIGVYHISYVAGRLGGGEITYDGNGRFSGHDLVSTFDGTYSVNPDGTGTTAIRFRTEDGEPIWPRPAKAMGRFRIHPGGGIEFESISSDGYMAGTEHKIEKRD